MAYGTVKGYCVEEECNHNPAQFTCHFCGALLCNKHFQEGHKCKAEAKAVEATAEILAEQVVRKKSTYQTKVSTPEPEKIVDKRRKRG